MRRKITCMVAFVMLFLNITSASVLQAPITITAESFGSSSPQTVTWPNTIQNGDFNIFFYHPDKNPEDSNDFLVGDGHDDQTSWLFDFTQDPNYSVFDTSTPLTSALLTITLTPSTGSFSTDDIYSPEMGKTGAPDTSSFGLQTGVTSTHSIELVNLSNEYNSSTILQTLTSSYTSLIPNFFNAGIGQISMAYRDDATVSYAKLELTGVQLPEPSSNVLFFLGLMGVTLYKKIVLRKTN